MRSSASARCNAGRSRIARRSTKAGTCWSSARCAGCARRRDRRHWRRPPSLEVDLRAWCRAEGHRFDWQPVTGRLRGQARHRQRARAESNDGRAPARAGKRAAGERHRCRASAAHVGTGGARRAVEAGTPEFDFHLVDKIEVWADDAARHLRAGRRRAVGSGDGDPVERAVRARRRGRRRRRAGHDVPDRERDRGADRSRAASSRSCIRTSAR